MISALSARQRRKDLWLLFSLPVWLLLCTLLFSFSSFQTFQCSFSSSSSSSSSPSSCSSIFFSVNAASTGRQQFAVQLVTEKMDGSIYTDTIQSARFNLITQGIIRAVRDLGTRITNNRKLLQVSPSISLSDLTHQFMNMQNKSNYPALVILADATLLQTDVFLRLANSTAFSNMTFMTAGFSFPQFPQWQTLPSNFISFVFRSDQLGFLAGVAAALVKSSSTLNGINSGHRFFSMKHLNSIQSQHDDSISDSNADNSFSLQGSNSNPTPVPKPPQTSISSCYVACAINVTENNPQAHYACLGFVQGVFYEDPRCTELNSTIFDLDDPFLCPNLAAVGVSAVFCGEQPDKCVTFYELCIGLGINVIGSWVDVSSLQILPPYYPGLSGQVLLSIIQRLDNDVYSAIINIFSGVEIVNGATLSLATNSLDWTNILNFGGSQYNVTTAAALTKCAQLLSAGVITTNVDIWSNGAVTRYDNDWATLPVARGYSTPTGRAKSAVVWVNEIWTQELLSAAGQSTSNGYLWTSAAAKQAKHLMDSHENEKWNRRRLQWLSEQQSETQSDSAFHAFSGITTIAPPTTTTSATTTTARATTTAPPSNQFQAYYNTTSILSTLGSVLIYGGVDVSGNTLNDVWVFSWLIVNPAAGLRQGIWEPVTPKNITGGNATVPAVSGHCPMYTNNTMYYFGGVLQDGQTVSPWLMSFSANASMFNIVNVSTLNPNMQGRDGHYCVSFPDFFSSDSTKKNYLILGGRQSDGTFTSEALVFDPETESFTSLPMTDSTGQPVYLPSGAAVTQECIVKQIPNSCSFFVHGGFDAMGGSSQLLLNDLFEIQIHVMYNGSSLSLQLLWQWVPPGPSVLGQPPYLALHSMSYINYQSRSLLYLYGGLLMSNSELATTSNNLYYVDLDTLAWYQADPNVISTSSSSSTYATTAVPTRYLHTSLAVDSAILTFGGLGTIMESSAMSDVNAYHLPCPPLMIAVGLNECWNGSFHLVVWNESMSEVTQLEGSMPSGMFDTTTFIVGLVDYSGNLVPVNTTTMYISEVSVITIPANIGVIGDSSRALDLQSGTTNFSLKGLNLVPGGSAQLKFTAAFLSGAVKVESQTINVIMLSPDARYDTVPDGLKASGYIFVGLSISWTLFLLLIITANRRSAVIRASSFTFNVMILVGCLVIYLGVFALIADPSNSICMARWWILELGIVTIFGSAFMKLYRIFRVVHTKTMRKVSVSDREMWLLLAVLWTVSAIVLVIFTALSPSTQFYASVTNDQFHFDSQCTVQAAFAATLIGLVGAVVLALVIVTIGIRSAPSEFNEASQVAIAIYNTVLSGLVIVPLDFVLDNTTPAHFVIRVFGTTLTIIIFQACIYLPKVFHVIAENRDKSRRRAVREQEIARMPSYAKADTGSGNTNSQPGAGGTKADSRAGLTSIVPGENDRLDTKVSTMHTSAFIANPLLVMAGLHLNANGNANANENANGNGSGISGPEGRYLPSPASGNNGAGNVGNNSNISFIEPGRIHVNPILPAHSQLNSGLASPPSHFQSSRLSVAPPPGVVPSSNPSPNPAANAYAHASASASSSANGSARVSSVEHRPVLPVHSGRVRDGSARNVHSPNVSMLDAPMETNGAIYVGGAMMGMANSEISLVEEEPIVVGREKARSSK